MSKTKDAVKLITHGTCLKPTPKHCAKKNMGFCTKPKGHKHNHMTILENGQAFIW